MEAGAYPVSAAFRAPPMTSRTRRAIDTLRTYLLVHGPATVDDVLDVLSLSRAEAYQVVHRAAKQGRIKIVAHVHTDDNHRSQAWDIDSPNGELLWRRHDRWVRGRYCTCLPAQPRTKTVGAA
jgi:hypothetical protein